MSLKLYTFRIFNHVCKVAKRVNYKIEFFTYFKKVDNVMPQSLSWQDQWVYEKIEGRGEEQVL